MAGRFQVACEGLVIITDVLCGGLFPAALIAAGTVSMIDINPGPCLIMAGAAQGIRWVLEKHPSSN